MNIIIPIGGFGKRFSAAGYAAPKPLIPVLGKPMVFWVLESFALEQDDLVTVAYNPDLKRHSFERLLRDNFPNYPFHFVALASPTRGAVDTVVRAIESLPADRTAHGCITLDCDTFYREDILQHCRGRQKSCIFYFEDPGSEPIFSYITLSDNDIVTDIAEKKKISSHANTGAYYFSSTQALLESGKVLLESKGDAEMYMSSVYKYLLGLDHEVRGVQVQEFTCVGTPAQLRAFIADHQREQQTV